MKKQYFHLSRKYHPDFFSNGTTQEKEHALQMSSLVNKAYKIFSHQDETIKYVLQLNELLTDEEKYELPNDFLMEIMELNEQIIEAKMEGDTNQLTAIKSSISSIQQNIYEPVKEVIESDSTANISQEKMLQVKDFYFKKKYLSRILESIK